MRWEAGNTELLGFKLGRLAIISCCRMRQLLELLQQLACFTAYSPRREVWVALANSGFEPERAADGRPGFQSLALIAVEASERSAMKVWVSSKISDWRRSSGSIRWINLGPYFKWK